eukprot:m.1521203 g.1521203  ORF g.1521203 m.1521203 type:complete len:472 (+) comp25229_c0_seq18:2850-4265(+)
MGSMEPCIAELLRLCDTGGAWGNPEEKVHSRVPKDFIGALAGVQPGHPHCMASTIASAGFTGGASGHASRRSAAYWPGGAGGADGRTGYFASITAGRARRQLGASGLVDRPATHSHQRNAVTSIFHRSAGEDKESFTGAGWEQQGCCVGRRAGSSDQERVRILNPSLAAVLLAPIGELLHAVDLFFKGTAKHCSQLYGGASAADRGWALDDREDNGPWLHAERSRGTAGDTLWGKCRKHTIIDRHRVAVEVDIARRQIVCSDGIVIPARDGANVRQAELNGRVWQHVHHQERHVGSTSCTLRVHPQISRGIASIERDIGSEDGVSHQIVEQLANIEVGVGFKIRAVQQPIVAAIECLATISTVTTCRQPTQSVGIPKAGSKGVGHAVPPTVPCCSGFTHPQLRVWGMVLVRSVDLWLHGAIEEFRGQNLRSQVRIQSVPIVVVICQHIKHVRNQRKPAVQVARVGIAVIAN